MPDRLSIFVTIRRSQRAAGVDEVAIGGHEQHAGRDEAGIGAAERAAGLSRKRYRNQQCYKTAQNLTLISLPYPEINQ